MVQFVALFPVAQRSVSASTSRRFSRGRRLHPPGFWHSGRLPYPRTGTFGLQIRSARTPTSTQRQHLAIAKHDVLQPGKATQCHTIAVIDTFRHLPTPGRRGRDNAICSLIRSVELKRISPLVCLAPFSQLRSRRMCSIVSYSALQHESF